MKKENLRQAKGITLIALVITIIVMLILVAVTITIAVNGGLFNYAKSAASRTNQAILDEQNLADLPDGWTYDNLIDKYTTGTQTTPTVPTAQTIVTVHHGDEYAETTTVNITGITQDQAIMTAIFEEVVTSPLSGYIYFFADTPGKGNLVFRYDSINGYEWDYSTNPVPSDLYLSEVPSTT